MQLSTVWQALYRQVLVVVLAALLYLPSFLIAQPSFAVPAPDQLSAEDQVERGYDAFGEDAGAQEEIYQQRLKEGQDPEKMPKPYKRILDIDKKKEVPETSLLETSVSKVRALVDRVGSDK